MNREDSAGLIKTEQQELDDLKKRFALLESQRAAFYQTSINTQQRNREQIQLLQNENKELRGQIKAQVGIADQGQTSQIANQSSSGAFIKRAPSRVEKDFVSEDQGQSIMKRKLDEQKALTQKKRKELLALQDRLNEISNEKQSDLILDDNPYMRKIRMLENRLDKAMIKYNEAQSIKRTYELIVKRLKEERVGYDNQLSAIQQSLKGKEHDYEELLLLKHDAYHAKEIAEADLRKFESKTQARELIRKEFTEKKQKKIKEDLMANKERERQLEEKFNFEFDDSKPRLNQRVGIKATGKLTPPQFDISRAEDDKEKLQMFEEAMKRIKEATGVEDVNEIIQKFVTQEDTTNNLQELKNENDKKLAKLTEDHNLLKNKLETLKYEALESMTRKQVDEVQKSVAISEQNYEKNKEKLERTNKVLINAKAGIEHLCFKINSEVIGNNKQMDPHDPIIVSETRLNDALNACEEKLFRLYASLKSEKYFPEVYKKLKSVHGTESMRGLREKNIRVKIEKEDEDFSEGSADEEVQIDSNERLKIKYQAQIRMDKIKSRGKKIRD